MRRIKQNGVMEDEASISQKGHQISVQEVRLMSLVSVKIEQLSIKLNNKRLLIDPCHENQQRLNKAVKTRNELNPYHVVPPVVQAHHNVDNGNNRKRRSEDDGEHLSDSSSDDSEQPHL